MLLIIILLLIIIINLMNVYFRKEKIIENNTGYDMSNTVKDCIVDWDEEYGPCSASCGGGTQELGYKVLQEPEDGYWNGKPQNAIQCPQTIKRDCNEQSCPINCEGEWSSWSPCQKDDGTQAKCGENGKRYLNYNIIKDAVDGYIDNVLTPGNACPDSESEICTTNPCQIDCLLGPWKDSGVCNKSCGDGEIKQTRDIITAPAHGGISCESRTRYQPCFIKECEIESGKYRIKTTYHEAGKQPAGWGLSASRVGNVYRNTDSSWVLVHSGNSLPMIWNVTKNTDGTYYIKTNYYADGQQPAGWGLSAWHIGDAYRNSGSSWPAVHSGDYWPMKWNIVPGEKSNTWRILTTNHVGGGQPAGWGLSAWRIAGAYRNSTSSWAAVHSGNYWPMDWEFEKVG